MQIISVGSTGHLLQLNFMFNDISEKYLLYSCMGVAKSCNIIYRGLADRKKVNFA
jgi:hypothetical protein